MSELLGLGSMAEHSCYCKCSKGPSTGMPTKSMTGRSSFYRIQLSYPKIILAASNVEENFYLTIDAFNSKDTRCLYLCYPMLLWLLEQRLFLCRTFLK